ncbi:VOC family protein [Streptococcus sp. 20-1249]|uniref:VOC family protein n=1 Tax=Streptococcus hepaticus TaxID=3349163 RepID=UPI00374A4572
MVQSMWLNFSSKSVSATADFFADLGFEVSYPQGETGPVVDIRLGKNGQIVYFSESVFARMAPFQATGNDALVSIDVESPEEVVAFLEKVAENGGRVTVQAGDRGGIFGGAFEDLDGHHFTIIVMPK